MKKLVAMVAALLFAAPLFAQPASDADRWREDLRAMATQMEARHANLYHSVDRAAFAAAVADLDARIPQLQRHQIIAGLMRIAAMVGDGHTNISPLKDRKFELRSLPLKLYLFDDGLYVRAAEPAQAALVGARVEAIGGVPVDEAIRRAGELAPRDNAMGVAFYVPIFLAMPALQHALGLAPTPEAAVLTLAKGGRRWTTTVAADEVDPAWPPDTDISLVTPPGWVDARGSAPLPLWLQAPLDYHRLIELPGGALYVQLNMVTGVEGETLAQFGERIAERVRALNPKTLVIDVRLNRGGNLDLRYPFVADLIRADDADTKLYLLVGRGAFSATQSIIDDLDRYTEAVLVGEPASSKPNSYGDSYRDTLPNSGLTVRSSILYHQLDHRDRDWTGIDIAAPLTFAAYAAGRDPALEVALARTAPQSLADAVMATADGAAARAAVEAWMADPVNRYADAEMALTGASLALLRSQRPQAAFAAAERSARALPASVRAAVVLAIAAEQAGDKDRARVAGLRALELDPDNRDARALIDRLKAR